MTKTNFEKVHFVSIDEHHTGQRIDNYLFRYLSKVPKSRIYRLIRKGEVRVNKKRVKAEYKLLMNDQIRIPPVKNAEEKSQINPNKDLLAHLSQAIIFEDKDLLVINKPSGLAVHGGSGINYGLIEAVRIMRPQQKFLELVHRLDRATSGCILIAKKRTMLNYLHQMIRDKKVNKIYSALLCGKWQGKQRTIKAPLLKQNLISGERMVRVDSNGKESISIFSPINVFEQHSLMDISIITGRTHQIRVHAQHIGLPLAGDEKYGNFSCNQKLKQIGLKRLFLHAASISIPATNEYPQLEFKVPLPEELSRLIRQLSKQPSSTEIIEE